MSIVVTNCPLFIAVPNCPLLIALLNCPRSQIDLSYIALPKCPWCQNVLGDKLYTNQDQQDNQFHQVYQVYQGLKVYQVYQVYRVHFFTKMSRNMRNNKVHLIFDFLKGFCHFSCFQTFYCIQKCLETGETTKSLEEVILSKGILLFFLFIDIFFEM